SAGVGRTHPLDLVCEVADGGATANGRGREGVSLSRHGIHEVHEPGRLPRVARFAVGTGLPVRFIEVAQLFANGEATPGFAHPVLDRLTALPFHVAGGGAQRNKPCAFRDDGALLAFRPAPVGELEQRTLNDTFVCFGCCIVPSVVGGRCWGSYS